MKFPRMRAQNRQAKPGDARWRRGLALSPLTRTSRYTSIWESIFTTTSTYRDTISSHDKKRHYLESLEQYIVYLHEQFSLLQQEHPPLQQVAQYKGLSSRSIRVSSFLLNLHKCIQQVPRTLPRRSWYIWRTQRGISMFEP